MKNLTLNYLELAFIMKIKDIEAKKMFSQIMNQDKITAKDFLESETFVNAFGTVVSVDYRYDGMSKFLFYLDQCKKSYKRFLNDTSFVKKGMFTSGKKVFYKILSEENLKHCEASFIEKTTENYRSHIKRTPFFKNA